MSPPAVVSPYRGRFAPSPTGPLHLGSLLAALGSWLIARHHNGEWLLRVEDIDPPREVAGAASEQIRVLEAFGLVSDHPVVWQSRRSDLYAAALRRLLDQGDAFTCRCSRSDLMASDGLHRQCVAHPSGRVHAYRLRVPDATLGFDDRLRGRYEQSLRQQVGDVVLKRADGLWAYQLAVVVDDGEQGITDVVRGADLLDSTPRQILLQQRLGLPTPTYAHLPLLLDEKGSKLSKSTASLPVDPDDPLPALRLVYGALGQPTAALGTGQTTSVLQRALASFDPALIPAKERRVIDLHPGAFPYA
ncbi:tRNA glutamyl-Q(34) synthetase GluQRS [Arenimonas oryziterrae]|uniref:Glutamyl-Q tRNA(Asp) synthetase n=1 Tax=Arenimonas oryziterrae DSM 21050 = YC6267 TaxID=1121015 RepID=A0A091AZ45_9GAMM|nr:tRNA glutamyl-Q(34) synthetase GluQRS [Arenimonas oryziterrae]KFN44567.1 hypothetical protein N789_00740 [Arenimonas oryziterrae DSM 21050 = YC6267]